LHHSDSQLLNAHPAARFPVDPTYYYRIDPVKSLRKILESGSFNVVRWDNKFPHHPHRELQAADSGKPHGHGIFRICFWISEQEGFNALSTIANGIPTKVLRVKRASVRQALPDWTFDLDDCLKDSADMAWVTCPVVHDQDVSAEAIALEEFEVWCDRSRAWIEFRDAIQSEHASMAQAGWKPEAIAPSITCYWRLVPYSDGQRQGTALIIVAAEGCLTHIGPRHDLVEALITHLANRSALTHESAVIAALAVHVTDSCLVIDEFSLAIPPVPRFRLWAWLRKLPRISVSAQPSVDRARQYAAIAASGLRHIKPARSTVWTELSDT